MSIQKVKWDNRAQRRLKTFAGILLLGLYLTGNVQVESFHQFFHSLEKALHSSEQEKDPCHRAIYHEAKNEGCNHKTHVTAVKNCPLCHVVPFNDQHFAIGQSPLSAELFCSFFILCIESIHSDILYDLPARAPPFV